MDGPLAPRKHAVLIENQQSDGLPLITALIFFPRNDPKCPDTFVITNCAHSILEPHFTFNVALKTKRFQVANPSLFVFNVSCSMTLKTQSQGQISKWLFVSSLRALLFWSNLHSGHLIAAGTCEKCSQGVMSCVGTMRSLEPGAL